MAVELLAQSVEVGLVTTNLDAMVGFYGDFLGLPHQGDLDFPGGTMKRYAIGSNVLKLVTLSEPPAAPVATSRWSVTSALMSCEAAASPAGSVTRSRSV